MSDETGKFFIFLSYIDEEKKIAEVLKEWIEASSLDQIEVFAYSDKESIDLGEEWHEKIIDALNRSNLLIVLSSEFSIERPWVNFESGAAWIKKIPIIPICHTGMSKDSIPDPYRRKLAINLDDKNFGLTLFKSIMKKIGYKGDLKTDFNRMEEEIQSAKNEIKYDFSRTKSVNRKNEVDQLELSDMGKSILRMLADKGDLYCAKSELYNAFNVHNQKVQNELNKFKNDDYIDFLYIERRDQDCYYLTPKGTDLVVRLNIV